jgi:hypothetical protein
MRKVEAPLSMTMGVDAGKRAKSVCRGGRWTGVISPGGGGGERDSRRRRGGVWGGFVVLLASELCICVCAEAEKGH